MAYDLSQVIEGCEPVVMIQDVPPEIMVDIQGSHCRRIPLSDLRS
jgi:hypothetical protein